MHVSVMEMSNRFDTELFHRTEIDADIFRDAVEKANNLLITRKFENCLNVCNEALVAVHSAPKCPR